MSIYYQGRRAQSYDQLSSPFTERTLSETLALLSVEAISELAQQHNRAPQLLDVACGTGILLDRLHQRFPTAQLIGIDGSQDMLAQAQARLGELSQLRLQQIVIGQHTPSGLPFPDASFDLITCTNVLHALPDPLAILADLRRLLVPGGHLLLADLAWGPPHFLWRFINWMGRRAGAGPLHPYTLAQACTLCQSVGFSLQASHSFAIDWLLHAWVIHGVKDAA